MLSIEINAAPIRYINQSFQSRLFVSSFSEWNPQSGSLFAMRFAAAAVFELLPGLQQI